MIKKRCIAFMISDFMGTGYQDSLKITARKHDLAALRIMDQREADMPDVGLIRFVDAETGKISVFDTGNPDARRDYNLWWKQNDRQTADLLNRNGVDHILLYTNQPYVQPLLRLFKKRERRS
jgi:hypothetical protein